MYVTPSEASTSHNSYLTVEKNLDMELPDSGDTIASNIYLPMPSMSCYTLYSTVCGFNVGTYWLLRSS